MPWLCNCQYWYVLRRRPVIIASMRCRVLLAHLILICPASMFMWRENFSLGMESSVFSACIWFLYNQGIWHHLLLQGSNDAINKMDNCVALITIKMTENCFLLLSANWVGMRGGADACCIHKIDNICMYCLIYCEDAMSWTPNKWYN